MGREHRRRARWAVLLGVGSMLASTPAHAHCGDDCTMPLPYSVAPIRDVVAADGVLGFTFAHGFAEAALEFFSVSVRDAEGAPVDGALELFAEFSAIVWRPSAPWVAGASYVLVTNIDTPAWAEAMYGAPPDACSTQDSEFPFTIEPAPLPAPAAPPIVVDTEHKVKQRRDLGAVVCCDGALPYMEYGPGSCPEFELVTDSGSCVSRVEHGTLTVSYHVDPEQLAPAVAGNLVLRVLDPEGQPLLADYPVLDAPSCLRFESLDLARGEVFVEERCLGADLPLGDLEIDPSAQLAEYCEGQPYVCEANYRQWIAEQCKTWPEGADHEYIEPVADSGATAGEEVEAGGCGCRSGDAPVGAPALLIGLALLRRRRALG